MGRPFELSTIFHNSPLTSHLIAYNIVSFTIFEILTLKLFLVATGKLVHFRFKEHRPTHFGFSANHQLNTSGNLYVGEDQWKNATRSPLAFNLFVWQTHSLTHWHTSWFYNLLNAANAVPFFSRSRSTGCPHHGRTFSIYLCPMSSWLTIPRGVLSTSSCCPSRPCVAFLACVHLALFLDNLNLQATPLFPNARQIKCRKIAGGHSVLNALWRKRKEPT